MDRQIVYPGAIPQDTDFLQMQKNVMIALGFANRAALGGSPFATGFAIAATNPASLSVVVGPGAMTANAVVDTLSFGSLGTDTTDSLIKMGITLGSETFGLVPPTTTGQSQIFLIYGTFSESQSGSTVLPYVNAANPAQPFSGPSNNGAAQFTNIVQRIAVQFAAGTPAVSPAAPVAPGGSLPFYLVTLTTGQTAITSANIAAAPGNPFATIGGVLQLNNAVFSLEASVAQLNSSGVVARPMKNFAVFQPTDSGVWMVPANVQAIRVKVWGGGGAGGNGFGGAGGGGGGGGYAEGFFAVTGGANYNVAVGNGGAGAGSAGEASSFGALISAPGGAAAASGAPGSPPVGGGGGSAAGNGTGGSLNFNGNAGSPGMVISASVAIGGAGGAAFGAAGANAPFGSPAGSVNGFSATCGPGAGASGGVGGGSGGQGGIGLIIIEY